MGSWLYFTKFKGPKKETENKLILKIQNCHVQPQLAILPSPMVL